MSPTNGIALETDDARTDDDRQVDARLEESLASIVQLANAMLKVGRFEEVARTVAPIGNALTRLKKQTALDYLKREHNDPAGVGLACDGGGLYDNAFGVGPNMGGAVNFGPRFQMPIFTDQHHLARETMLTTEKQTQALKDALKEQNAAKQARDDAEVATNEARELVALHDLLARLPDGAPERGPLEARIRVLVSSIGARAVDTKPNVQVERIEAHVATAEGV